jgi:hypothetical protein
MSAPPFFKEEPIAGLDLTCWLDYESTYFEMVCMLSVNAANAATPFLPLLQLLEKTAQWHGSKVHMPVVLSHAE